MGFTPSRPVARIAPTNFVDLLSNVGFVNRVSCRHDQSSIVLASSGKNAGLHLADLSSDLTSATGPRCASLSGLTIALMLVI